MTKEIPSGRFQSLTAEEEWKLKEVWSHFLKFWGTPVVLPIEEKPSIKETASQTKPKKKLFSKFRRSKKKSDDVSDQLSATTTRSAEDIEASYNAEVYHDSLKDLKPEEIYDNFWNMLRTDTPDNLILRFLRARKWDSDKALTMFAHTLHWRLKERNVDQLLLDGDRKPVEDDVKGFVLQLEEAKAYIRGHDLSGRPIVHIRPRLHIPSAQTMDEIENYTLLIIEEARLFLKEPVDSASILFDLSDFSMSNMDYPPVKFMIAVFEAHYPESLGRLFIHKAPWIFPPIWNIVKNWLDPVVASKIVFTKNPKDLEKYISIDHIPQSLGGKDDFDPKFIQPNAEDDKLMKDTETKLKLQNERKEFIEQFIKATVNWIEADSVENSKKFKNEKIKLGLELSRNYVNLDPYIRSRNYYDRTGLLKLEI